MVKRKSRLKRQYTCAGFTSEQLKEQIKEVEKRLAEIPKNSENYKLIRNLEDQQECLYISLQGLEEEACGGLTGEAMQI